MQLADWPICMLRCLRSQASHTRCDAAFKPNIRTLRALFFSLFPTPHSVQDIKSPNLLVTRHGDLKIADLGLASVYSPSKLEKSVENEDKSGSGGGGNQQAGTLAWMAPEVVKEHKCGPDGWRAADMYSFGAVLFELGTLRRPWHGLNDLQIFTSVGFKDVPLVLSQDDCMVASDGSVEAKAVARFVQLANECLEKNPASRLTSAEAIAELEAVATAIRAT